VCVAMEPKLTLSISGHKRAVSNDMMSAKHTYRTFPVKYALDYFHGIVFFSLRRIIKCPKSIVKLKIDPFSHKKWHF
ncbi:hypothetical protein RGU76_29830, partial [Bacillus pseudomycoides]|uniref:hypothetical protein n=1 Tax=Bacillus pseudomycoides TaxID=64104 RepID=UPI0028534007